MKVNADEEYNSYLSSSWQAEGSITFSSSESSSGSSTPRGLEDTELKKLSLADKMTNLKTDMSHGKGFQRF